MVDVQGSHRYEGTVEQSLIEYFFIDVLDFFGNLGLQRRMLLLLPHRLYTDMDKRKRKLVVCSILQIRSQLDSASKSRMAHSMCRAEYKSLFFKC